MKDMNDKRGCHKRIAEVALIVGMVMAFPWLGLAAEPVRLIFDTDMGNDIDDALALALIHALQDRGECELLAVTVSKENAYAASYVDAVNTYYGRPDIPIGRVEEGMTPEPGKYVKAVVETKNKDGKPRYPFDLGPDSQTPEAVSLLRKTLAAQADHSVVLVVVGFSTNAVRLMDSKADEYSPLNGVELISKKIKLLSMMAGSFEFEPEGPGEERIEYNVKVDIPSAKKVIEHWPTKLILSPWYLGASIKIPAVSMERDYGHSGPSPVQHGYRLYGKMPYDRPCYDLTSVLVAVRPDLGYFNLDKTGRVRVDQQGRTVFEESENGNTLVMTADENQRTRVREAFVFLCSQPPLRKGK
jgi:inosine-uridine nucleoside N-ribohydrolase